MKIPKARKLPSGTWFIQLRLGGESIPVTAQTERECTRTAQLIKAEHQAGKREAAKNASSPVTLGEAVESYISSRENILSPSTVREYRTIRNTRFQSVMMANLDDIAEKDWVEACNREAALCAPKTLTNAWRFLCSVLRYSGYTPPKITLPQIPPNERPFLAPEQIKIFLSAIEGTNVELPALLGLHSLRRSEICALRWENVDIKKGRLHIKGAAVYDENYNLVQKPTNKNRSSTRYVPIMIDRLRVILEQERKPSGLVIDSMAPSTIRKRVNRICAKHDLPLIGSHGLRHSFASLAYHLGIPEKVAMEIGGWSDLGTMHKIYTHIAQSDMKRYETAMADFFNAAH
jgi:integrase